jgi:hypothetical protein
VTAPPIAEFDHRGHVIVTDVIGEAHGSPVTLPDGGHRCRRAGEDCTGYDDSRAGGAGASLEKDPAGLGEDPSAH